MISYHQESDLLLDEMTIEEFYEHARGKKIDILIDTVFTENETGLVFEAMAYLSLPDIEPQQLGYYVFNAGKDDADIKDGLLFTEKANLLNVLGFLETLRHYGCENLDYYAYKIKGELARLNRELEETKIQSDLGFIIDPATA